MNRTATRLTACLLVAALTVLPGLAGGVAAPAGGGGVAESATGPAAAAAPAAAAGVQGACSFPTNVTDATNTTVTIEERPERVVVLGASAAQTVWEVGAADRVVGIDAFSTYLEGAGEVPVVSQGYNAIDYEAALSQNPDLVIVDGNSYSSNPVSEFRSANVTTVKLADAGSLGGIYNKTHTVGRLLGACDAANRTVASMREQVETVEAAVASVDERPSLYYGYGRTGRWSAGPGSFIHDLITTAGAHNVVVENYSTPFPQVSGEFIVEQDPQWLLTTYNPAMGENASNPRALLPNSDAINQTQAYEAGNVIAVNVNYLNQPAPRVVRPLATIAKTLHPEAYAAANATTTAAPTTESTATSDAATSTAPPATTGDGGDGGSIPGFGPAAALAGLAAAGALARRRAA
ncbi:MAG: PGF-CTERM-anchored ABC transporter substrate-binding protein [Halobacteriaceae archaeon]